jgi:hypothetical protein
MDVSKGRACSENCERIAKDRDALTVAMLKRIEVSEAEKKEMAEEKRKKKEEEIRKRKQKGKEKRKRSRTKQIIRLKARQLIEPSKDRQMVIHRLEARNGAVPLLKKELAAKTEQIRALKQGREPNGFYESRQWQELRYRALRHHGRKCMLCFATDCELHVDHIKPRSKYPELALQFENLQVLCRACNMGKSNKDETDWRPSA